jgi:transposase
MESSDREQRVNMKFYFKLGTSATETHKMLVEFYVDAAVTRKTVYKWSERFRSGSESIDDDEDRDALRLRAQTKTFRK